MRIPLVFLIVLGCAHAAVAQVPQTPSKAELTSLTNSVMSLQSRVTRRDQELSARCKEEWPQLLADPSKVSEACRTDEAGNVSRFMAAVKFCEALLARARVLANPSSTIPAATMRLGIWNLADDVELCERRAKEYGID